MGCVEMVLQVLLSVQLIFTRVVRASSIILVKLAINMIFNVITVVARILHLHKSPLCHLVDGSRSRPIDAKGRGGEEQQLGAKTMRGASGANL